MSIHVENLSHIYSPGMPDEFHALKDINFDIEDGSIVGVIGHTGSGKSTLMQHMNGLLKPTAGTITVNGIEITNPDTVMLDVRKKVGLVFQYPEYQLFEENVALDIAFGPKNLGLSEEEIEKRVKRSLELVALDYDDIKDRSPFELSGGQKRRVAIAGVIAMKPEVLILDEPTAGLDPGAHRDILNMIREIHKVENNIIIFVSHNMADVADLADRVMVLDKGSLMMTGTPKEVFAKRDKLKSAGLSVPPVTEFMYGLKEKGVPVTPDVLSIEEAAESIAEFIRKQE